VIRKVLIENYKSISNLTIELGRHFETNPKLNKLHQRQFLFRLKVNAVPYFCLSGSMSGEWKRKVETEAINKMGGDGRETRRLHMRRGHITLPHGAVRREPPRHSSTLLVESALQAEDPSLHPKIED